ncbi:MAG: UPF0758 domain-containing protein [Caulobacteraceae bacterium]
MDRPVPVRQNRGGFAARSGDRPAPAHTLGHRDRLRLRARRAGPASLPDYELLELYLYRSIPRSDVKPLAKTLLTRFGGLAGVLGAAIADLRQVPGVGEAGGVGPQADAGGGPAHGPRWPQGPAADLLV